jgi:hypothetical protein
MDKKQRNKLFISLSSVTLLMNTLSIAFNPIFPRPMSDGLRGLIWSSLMAEVLVSFAKFVSFPFLSLCIKCYVGMRVKFDSFGLISDVVIFESNG